MSMSNTTKRIKEIRRKTRRKFSSEEMIRIVLDGLRGESCFIGSDQHNPLKGNNSYFNSSRFQAL